MAGYAAGVLAGRWEGAVFLAVHDLEIRPIEIEQGFARGEIAIEDISLEWVGPLQVSGRAEWTGGGIRLNLHLEGEMAPICARCLIPVTTPLDRELELFYRPAEALPSETEMLVPAAEIEVAFFRGAGLELSDLVREQVLLALPMRTLCSEDCRGLCPGCSVNLNREACRCTPQARTLNSNSPFRI